MKIQHWFFSKIKHKASTRKVLKVNPILKKSSNRKSVGARTRGKENQGRSQQNMQADSEQAIIDACWSVNMLGDKVRSKMLQQVSRAKQIRKSQPPAARAKTPSRTAPQRQYKRSILSRVLIVKEDKSPEDFNPTSRGAMNLTGSIKGSPKAQSSLATSVFSELNANAECGDKFLCASEVAAFHTGVESAQLSAGLVFNPSYKTLKGQIGMCVRNENKGKRKRRGRKERGKYENDQSTVDANNVTVAVLNERLLDDQNDSKLNESTLTSISNNVEAVKKRTKSGARKATVQDISRKSFICSTKQVGKLPMREARATNKKDINPKRYIARKYLGELYDKVIFRVREIERDRKFAATLQNPKATLDKSTKQVLVH